MPLYQANQIISDANLNANGAQVDNTVISGAFTSPTPFTKLWDISANSSQTGSAWRLTTIGQSVMGTTALAINWGIGYGPNGATTFIIDNETQPASSTWYFTVVVWFVINIGGSGGRGYMMGQIRAGQIPNNSVANWCYGILPFSWNSTVDNKLCMVSYYSATTGSPVCTVSCSVLEKLG